MGRQFAYFFQPQGREHMMTAFADDPFGRMHMGALTWNDQGEIQGVHVKPQYRRRGVATGMFNAATELANSESEWIPTPEHSPNRTESGDAWAKAVGGVVPPLQNVLPSE